tara:strand:- start:753 stop:1010 length:258 start_codon:yes stop_codon:yes gene_type:complete
MSTIAIDGTDYPTDSLSDEARSELISMQACDQKITALKSDLAIATTARNAYAYALKNLLPKLTIEVETTPAPKVKAKTKAKIKTN